jgi:putative thioredoxin
VPVLVDFYSVSSEQSRVLSASILGLVEEFGNRILLGRVDTEAHARLAEAFNVQQSATLLAVVKGQPLPLTQGDQPAEQIEAIITKLLLVAEQNGVNGTIVIDENAAVADAGPQLPPAHQAAVELLNAQKYAEAKAAYEQILRDAPADPLAPAGVSQADLLLRLEGVDVDSVLNNAPQNFDELLQAADALLAIGDYADAFDALLKNYADAEDATKAIMKERLLSYFEIVGKTSPEVVAARAKLTSLLF